MTPPSRSLAIAVESGLIEVATSIDALNGEVRADRSFDSSTPSASSSPRSLGPVTIPGDTHLPRASTTVAPAGTATPAPAATMRPSLKTTVPFGIGCDPSPSATVPPVIATVCAERGAAINAAAASRTAFT